MSAQFVIPAGQEAADKIFSAKERKPLDKKAPAGEVTQEEDWITGLEQQTIFDCAG